MKVAICSTNGSLVNLHFEVDLIIFLKKNIV